MTPRPTSNVDPDSEHYQAETALAEVAGRAPKKHLRRKPTYGPAPALSAEERLSQVADLLAVAALRYLGYLDIAEAAERPPEPEPPQPEDLTNIGERGGMKP